MYFNGNHGIALITLPADDGEVLKRIDTECGVVVSPVADAEVIVYGPDGTKIVYEAVYGRLPCELMVVAIKDGSGTFPMTDQSLRVKIIAVSYQESMSDEVISATLKPWMVDGCPICGTATYDDSDDLDDGDSDDDDSDDGDDFEPLPDDGDDSVLEIPMPRRFVYSELVPSVN